MENTPLPVHQFAVGHNQWSWHNFDIEGTGASAKRIKSGRRRHLQLWRARPTISPVASDDVTRAGHLRTGRSPGFGELEAQRPKFLRLADACASAKRIKSGRRRHLQLWRARPTISPVASDDVTRAGHLRTGRSPDFGELEAQRPKFLRLADACASAKRIKSGRRRHLQLWRARPTISPVASDDVTRAGHLRTGRSPDFGELEAQRPKFLRLADACASAKRIKSGRRRHLQLWRARPTISPVASDDVTRAGHLRTGRSPDFGELEAQRPKFLRLADACASAKRIKSGRRRHLQLWRARPTISPVASDDVTRAGHLRTGRSPDFGELEAQRPKFLRLADACASAKRIKSGRRRHLQLWRARPTISPVASDDVTRAGHLRTGRSPDFGELEAQRPKFLRLADACASAKRIKSGRRRHLQLWRARPTISPVASDDVTRAGHLRTGRSPDFGELEAQRPKFLRLADACASAKRIKSGRRRHLQLWRARPTISPVASDDVTRAGHLRTGRSPDFGELEAQRPKFLRLADACASAKRIKSGRRRHLQLWRARPTISPVASDDVTRAGHLRTGRSPDFGELEAQRPKFLRLADACASAKRIKSGRRRHLQLWRARPTISPVASDDVTRAGHLRTGRSPDFGELEAQRPKFLRLADACASAKRIKSGRRRHLQLWRARPTISPVASDDVTRAGHLRTGRSPDFGELEAQRPKFLRLADACASAKRIKSGRRRHLQLWRARPTISPVASDDVTRAGHLRTGRSPDFGELEAQRPKFLRLADACASAKRIKSGRRRHLQLWRARPTISPVASDDVTRAGHLRTGRSPDFGELEAQRPKFLRLADACASAKRIKSGRRRHLQLWRARPTISPVASDDVTRAGHLRTGRSPDFGELEAQRPKFLRLADACASAKRIKSGRRRHLQLWRARPTISPVASDDVTRAGHLRTGRSPDFGELEAQRPKFLRLADACASAKRIKSGRRRHLQLWRARPTISPVASDDVTRAGHLRTGRSPDFGELEAQRPKFLRLADACASAKRIKSGRRRHLQLWRARPTISPVASDDVTRAGHLRTGRSPDFGELEAQRPKFLRLADACASAKRIKSGRRRHLQLWRARPTISPVASDDVTRAGHLRTGRSPDFGELEAQRPKFLRLADACASAKRIKSGRRRHLQLWRARPTISPVASDDVTRAGHLRTGRSPDFGELEAQRPKFLRLADACASAKRIKSGRRRHLQLWRARPTISPVASDDVTRAGHLRTGRSPDFGELEAQRPKFLRLADACASAKRIKSGRRRHLQLWRARPTISPVASDDVTRAGHLRTGRSPDFGELEAQRPKFLRLADACASAKRIKSGRRRHLQLWRARPTISPVASDDVTRAGHLRTGRSPDFGELEAQRPKFLRLADACASAKRIKSGRRRHLQLWRARPTISPVASDDVTRAGHLRTGRSPDFGELEAQRPKFLRLADACASAKRIKSGRRRHLQLWRARPTISPVASDDVTRAGHLRTGRSPDFGELEAQRPKFLRLADACASAKRIKSGRRRHLQLWRARPTISPVASDDVTRAGHLRTGRSPDFGELEAQRPKFLRLADACASAKRIKSGRRRHLQLWRARPTISPVASDDVTRAGHLRTGRSPDFGELEAQRPKFLRLADACASAKRIKSGRRRHLQLWRARPTISPVASDDVTRAGHLRTGRSPDFGELEAQRPKFLRLADACASAKRIKSGRRRHLQLWRARPTISPVASDDVTRAGHLRTGRSPDFGELEAQRPKFLRLADACASAKRIKSGRRRHLQLWRARPTISPVASDDVTRAGHLRTGRSPDFGELEAQRPKFLRLADACASAKRIKSGRRRHLQLWRARPTISPVASDDVTRAGHLRTGRSPDFGELEAQRPKFLRLADACASAKRIKSGRRRHLQLWRARPTISPVASDDVTRAGHLRTGRSPDFGELEAQRPKFLRLADACASAKRIKSGRRRHLQLWRARPTISPVASDDVTRAGHLRTGRSPDFGELEAQRPKFLRLADACASAKRIKSGRRRHLQLWRARPTISPVASDDVTRAGHLRTGRSPDFGELEAQRPKFLRLADACASAKRIKSGRRRHLQLWRARPTISPVASDDVTRAGHLRTGRSPDFGELEAQRPKFLRLADACASAKRIKSGRRRHLQLWRARPTISPVASDDVTRAGHLRTGRSPDFGELEAQRPKFLRLADACASAKRIKSGRRRHLQLWRARPTISPVASDDVTRAGHLRTGRSPDFGELEAQRPKFLRLADACASAKRIKSGRRRHLQLWRARPTISPVASDDVTRAGHLRTGRSPDFGELEAQRPKFLRLADACASAKRIKSGRRRHLQLWRARPTISPVASDDVTRAGHLRTGRSPDFGELEAQRPKFLRLADACASAKRIKSGRRRHLQLWRARPTISPVASDDVTRAGHLRTGRSPDFGELEAQRPKFLRLADACASAKRIKSGRRRHLQLWRARPTISPVASDDVTRAGHLRTGRSPDFGELEAQRPKFLRLADACASAKRIKSGRRRHLQLWRARPTISPVASDDVTRAGHLRTGRSPDFGELEAQRPKFLRLADACASAKRIKSGRRRHLQLWRARPTISPVASDDVTRAGHLRTGRSPDFGELEAQRPKFLRLADACASAKRIKSGRRRHLQLWRARPTISPVASDDVTRAGHLRTGRSPDFGELEAQRPKFLRLADACASAKRIKSGRRRHLQLWRARPTISPVASDDVTRAGHLRTGRSPDFGELEAQRPKFLRLADACASAKRIKSGRRRHLQLWRARPTISPVASDDVTRAGHLRTGRSPDFGELEAQRPKFLRLADACASAKRIKSGRRRHLQLWRARPTISPVASDDVTRAGHLRTGRSPDFGELEAQRPKFLRLADACASAKRIKSGRRRHLQLWRARPTISPVASDDVTRAGHLRTGRSPDFGELEAQRPKFLRLADACASAKRIKSGRRRHLQLWRARPTISPVASDDVTRAGHLRTGRSPDFGELEAQRPKFLRLADACASAKRIKSGRRRHLQLWRARPTISPVASDDVTRAGHLRTGRSPDFGELEAQRPKFLRLADACASAKRIKSGRRRHLQLWRARPTISPVASDDVTRAGHLRTGRSPDFGELEAQRPKFLRLADACASAKRIKSGRRRHLQLWRARPTISPVASDDVTRAGHLRTGRSPDFGELEAQRPKFLRLADACASAKRIKSGRRRHLQLWRARPTISPVASDDVTRAGHLRTGRSPDFGELEAQRPKFLRLADACASAKRIKSGRRRHLQLWRARPTISPVASDDVTRAGHLRTGRSPDFGELEAQRPKFLRLADACASAKRIKSGRRRHLQLWRARPTISPVASDDVTRAGHLRTGRSPDFGELEAQRPKFLRLADACASAKRIKSGRRRHLQLWRARPTISPVASDDVTRAGHLRTGRSPDFGELEAQRPKFLRLADACASAKRIKSGRRRHLQLWRARPTISPVASDDVTRAGHLRTGRSPDFGELEAQRPKFLRLADACASAKRIKSGRRRHLQLWRARPTISPVASDDVTRAGHLRTGRSPDFGELEAQRPKFLRLADACASAKRIKSGRRRHLQLWRARPTISPVASDDVTRAGHLRTGRSPDFGELEAQRPKFLRLADACASAKRIKSGRRRHLQLWRARPTISPVASDDVTRAGHLRTGRSPDFGELEAQRPKFLRLADACASAKRIKSGRRRHLQLWRARPTISPVASDDVTRAGHLRTGRSPDFGELEAQRPKFLRLADACASAKRIKSGRRRHLQLWRARPTISPVASDDVTRAGHLRTGRSPDFGELEAQRPKFLRLADACASAKRIKSGRRRHLQLWRARPTISPVASDDVTRAGHLRTGRSPDFGELEAQRPKFLRLADACASAKRIKSGRRRHLQLWRARPTISPVASDDVTRAGHLRTGRSPDFGELEAQRPKFLRLADACASAKRIKSGRRRHLQLWRARPTISPVASDDVTRAGHLRTGRSPDFGELEAQRPKFLRLADACASAKRIKSGRRRHLQLWRARPTISPVASDDVTRAGHLRTGRSPDFGELEAQRPKFLRLADACASAKRIKSGRRRHLQLWRARPTISPVASDDVTRAGHLRTGRSPDFGELEAQRPKFLRLADACASAKRIKSGRRRHLQLWRARPTVSPVASDDVTRAGHLRTGRSPDFGELEAQRPKFLRLADACASAKRIKSGRRRHLQLWRARPTVSPVASDDVTRAGHLRTGRSPDFGELEAQRPKFLRLADACASAKRIKSGRRRHLQLWRARPTISPVASDDVTRAGHLRTGRSPDFGELEAQRPKFLRLADACASAKRIKSGRRRHLQLWRARPTVSPVASDDVTRAGHLRTGRSPDFGELEAQRPKFLRLADACASAKRIKSGRRRHLQLWRARPTISPVASDDVTRAGHLRTGRSPDFGELEAQRPKFLRLADACASAKRIKSGRRRHLQLWRARPRVSPVASDDVTRAGHLRTGRSPDFGELEAQRPKFLRLADACRRKIPVGRITAGP
ncbi:hypothetical protein Bbelb_429740 [Branchiostoma belcheri]|nr:hypothetical protein Bbelb_429740 [Branchiostoma belcheri]